MPAYIFGKRKEQDQRKHSNYVYQKYSPAYGRSSSYVLGQVCQFIKKAEPFYEGLNYSCTIIIPVYNGYNHLLRLFPSIIRNTNSDAKIIVIDDASPDEKVVSFLESLSREQPDWIFLKNKKNLGFELMLKH